MADSDSKTARAAKAENDERLRLYAVGVVALVVLAIISVLLIPSSGSGVVARCNSLLLQQDRYGCVESAAITASNGTMCGTLTGSYRDSCYLSVAMNTTNLAFCGRINSTNASNECYMYFANYTDNPSVCEEIGGALGSECAYHIAVATNSTGDCSFVNGTRGRLDCNATVDFDNAVRYDNSSYCAGIYSNNDTATSEGILQNSSAGRYPDLSLNITQMLLEITAYHNQTMGARDLCYTSLAYKSHNSTYCSGILNASLNSLCSSETAGSASGKNASTNSTLNMTALLNSCNGQANATVCRYTYMYLNAEMTGNVMMCKNIPSNYSSLSFQCFYNLAEKYNSTSYCGYITNSTLNSACVGVVEGLYPASTNTSD